MALQTTLKRPVKFTGKGLHNGIFSELVIRPADEDTGIVFLRNGLALRAGFENICPGGSFALALFGNGARVFTVEHLLAALLGLGIDNAVCKLTGSDEIPALDGSSLPYAKEFFKTGIQKLSKAREEINLDKEFLVEEEGRFLIVKPCKELKISYFVSYANQVIGSKYFQYVNNKNNFLKEIAPARTFGWMEQVKIQKRLGLIKGASKKNAVLFGKKGVLNKEGLRFKDEVVRHKITDLLGAIALLPIRIKAHFIAFRSGHELDTKLIKEIGGYLCRK